ncbi:MULTISPECIES: hypothetical protein [unclassified Duganella]|uniref:hypothetical protein n=1 Tax=unclassified Duganella TaxID=2636909 RepID=UPI0011C0E140|nr:MULTISPECIES: hypothetical protein [unclassified Duganella]
MIKYLTSFTALVAFQLTCYALPQGTPPPIPMTFVGDYWDCVLPIKIAMKGPSSGYIVSDLHSKVVSRFRKNDEVNVLKVIDVVLEPSIAEVKQADFENNHLGLHVGDQVYALAEWEFLYFHAWVNGCEVDGGLPLGDETYFKFIGAPKVERWVLLQKFSPPKTKSWVQYNDALRDDRAIESCTRFQHH